MRRKLAAGNWKMNGTAADLTEIETLARTHADTGADILICPPFPLIDRAARTAQGSPVQIGAQTCHPVASGAHTGDVSAAMVADAGARFVITGHSERRQDHGESNDDVRAQTETAQAAGLIAIVCIGESLAEREAGDTLAVIARQLSGSVPEGSTDANLVIAYEPIWAIGTGLVPELTQIGEVHQFLRTSLTDRFGPEVGSGIRLLYGGSVKPGNAADIFGVPDVDGALVGGASLRAADFSPIITALANSA